MQASSLVIYNYEKGPLGALQLKQISEQSQKVNTQGELLQTTPTLDTIWLECHLLSPPPGSFQHWSWPLVVPMATWPSTPDMCKHGTQS